jgi:hypothetical protein
MDLLHRRPSPPIQSSLSPQIFSTRNSTPPPYCKCFNAGLIHKLATNTFPVDAPDPLQWNGIYFTAAPSTTADLIYRLPRRGNCINFTEALASQPDLLHQRSHLLKQGRFIVSRIRRRWNASCRPRPPRRSFVSALAC